MDPPIASCARHLRLLWCAKDVTAIIVREPSDLTFLAVALRWFMIR